MLGSLLTLAIGVIAVKDIIIPELRNGTTTESITTASLSTFS